MIDNKKQKIAKSLKELLSEVFDGKYEDFRAFISQENRTLLTIEQKRSDKFLKNLGQALQGTTITELRLLSIGADGIKALADVLKGTITHLNLKSWGWRDIGTEGAKSLAAVLKDTNITHLVLNWFHIEAEGATALAAVLKDTKMTSLDLYGNEIGDEGGKALAAVLKDTKITSLNLGWNGIGAEGVKALAAVLKETNITSLDLRGNSIDDEGATALAAVLSANIMYPGLYTTQENGENDKFYVAITPIETKKYMDPWQSKFGGQPYLPKGYPYPKHENGKPRQLLAQINFEEMPTLEHFPEKGILQFYSGSFPHDHKKECTDYEGPYSICKHPFVIYHETIDKENCQRDIGFSCFSENEIKYSWRRNKNPISFFSGDDYYSLSFEKRKMSPIPRYSDDVDFGDRIGGYTCPDDTHLRADFNDEGQNDILLLKFEYKGYEYVGPFFGIAYFINTEDLKVRNFSKVSELDFNG
jgi:uncharacterized protein YwqG